MVEETFDFSACAWMSAQPRALFYGAVNQLFFRRFLKDELDGFVGSFAINLFHLKIALKSLATYGLLPHLVIGIAESEPFIVQVAVLAKLCEHCFDNFFIRPLLLKQSLAQFSNRARLCGQEFYRALKGALARLLRIEHARRF